MNEKILFIDSETPGYYFPLITEVGNILENYDLEYKIAVPSKNKVYRFGNLICTKKLYIYTHFKNNDNYSNSYITQNWDIYSSFSRQDELLKHVFINNKIYHSYITFFENIYRDFKPTIIISENISNAFFMAAFRIAEKFNLLYLQIQSGRLSNSLNFYKDLSYKPIYHKKNSQRDNKFSPDYMSSQKAELKLKEIPRYLKSNFVYSPELGVVLWARIKYLMWLFNRMIKEQYYRVKYRNQRFTDIEEFCSEKKVLLFPLHFRPEASTSVQSKYYKDDVELLRNISFSLKTNEVLLVKEHPNALGIRGWDFYKEVQKFPNIKIVRHDIDLERLLKVTDICITLTSTVGYEALINDIPVILLGNVFYSEYPGVINLESIDKLRNAIEKAHSVKNSGGFIGEEIVKKYKKACFPGRFDYRNKEVLAPENIKQVASSIYKVIENEK